MSEHANTEQNVTEPCEMAPRGWTCSRRAGHDGPCAASPDDGRDAFDAAVEAGERSHLLTIGSPVRGLCLRVTMGRLSRRGHWHAYQPCVFLIWKGKRV